MPNSLVTNYVCQVVNKHWDEIAEDGWNENNLTKEMFIKEIKETFQTALWALTEIIYYNVINNVWKNTGATFYIIENHQFIVLQIKDSYIKLEYIIEKKIWGATFCERKTKTVYYFE